VHLIDTTLRRRYSLLLDCLQKTDAMIWILVRKELLTNLLTLRMDSYRLQVKELRQTMDQATIYAQIEPDIVLPPQPIAIFCQGVEKTLGSRILVRLDYIPNSPTWTHGVVDSNLMKTLVQIDFTLVVALLLSFLAVALGFDGICGERERGTLRQLLTNPIPRGSIILAKAHHGFRGAVPRTPLMRHSRSALPLFFMLCTNSKKPR
jgi:ABC-type transport system involved in multi-copper enzyme maturation permease subunit